MDSDLYIIQAYIMHLELRVYAADAAAALKKLQVVV